MLLSEMFGVERGTEFGVEGLCGKFRVMVNNGYEFLVVSDGKGEYDTVVNGVAICRIIDAAPSGIIHLPPPLTDEQREQLKAIWTLGGRWLAKDMTGDTFAFGYKPVKSNDWLSWIMSNDDKDENLFSVYRDLEVCGLVSWADTEPYDIAKALWVEGAES